MKILLLLNSLAEVCCGVEARQADALTMDVLDRLLATCGADLIGLRDRALMLVGVSAGGRRRSELTAFNMADIKRVEGGYVLIVRRSKTDQTGQGLHVPVRGRAAKALTAWIEAAGITEGRIFRSLVNRKLGTSLSGNSVSDIVARRAKRAGVEGKYSAHSLRSGFVSQAARAGIGLLDTMQLSGHKSVDVCKRYFRAADTMLNPAGIVFG